MYISVNLKSFKLHFSVHFDSSGDSDCRLITPTRRTKRPTSCTLKKYLVSATNLYSRPTNIVGLSIVLWSPTSH